MNHHLLPRRAFSRPQSFPFKHLLAALAVVASAGCDMSGTVQGDSNALTLEVVSTAPQRVTGNDALVRVTAPRGSESDVRVTLNGSDVSTAFHQDGEEPAMVGLVSGLQAGSNTLAASAGGRSTTLAVVNHPITGPVFAGPKEQPFVCETATFPLQGGGTLGPPLDDNCSIATRVDYVYRARGDEKLRPLPAPTSVPGDADTITTGAGATVPYVVRIETGTINRAIYQTAVLHNPASEPPPDFARHPLAWNRRLIFTFGGGCMNGWYHQAITTGDMTDDAMLRRGYAVASSTLNVAGNNCDTVLSAETMMMVKERFIEAYGTPLFTIGWGCSGGSYQVHEIADLFPGLLDGIIPGCSFPDVMHALTTTTSDSRLLGTYFKKTKINYSEEQKRAIGGYVSVANIMDGYTVRAARINATETCPPVLPLALRYDPVKNRTGARCDIYGHSVNILGHDPATGFARRPLDNVGVQYGLAALNAGTITVAQFLDLNENVGGYDEDGVAVPRTRTVADPEAIRIAYRTGRVTSGAGGLAEIPIIDYRSYADDAPKGDPHLRYHSFSMRARLLAANGTADNHIMLTERAEALYNSRSAVLREALDQMDRWLTNLSKDTAGGSAMDKMRRAKPPELVDACWTRDTPARKIVEPQLIDGGECAAIYPPASFPRGVAGSPIQADIVKCQLKPIDPADYRTPIGASELARLKSIFPGGVCDWSKPGVDQQPLAGAWPTF